MANCMAIVNLFFHPPSYVEGQSEFLLVKPLPYLWRRIVRFVLDTSLENYSETFKRLSILNTSIILKCLLQCVY
jgi:hypothetical protein